LAAFKGLVAAEPERAFDLLARAITGDDEQERRVAVRILGDDSAARDVKRFVDSFQTYSLAAQVALLETFRSRHEAAARRVALAAAESSETPLRLGGLRALTTIGAAADVPMLARRAAGQGDEKPIARAALASLPAPQVDAAILEILPASSPEVSVEVLNALVARGTEGAGQGAAARLTDHSELVRTAALKALAELGGAGQVAAVVASLKAATNDSGREAAQSALAAVAGRVGPESVDEILKGLEAASIESQIALLHTLGNAGGPKALAAVGAALTHSDERVRESAFRVLADWSSVEAAPELLRLARTSADRNWRVLAFRGYVRLCREGDSPPEARMRLLAEGMRTASEAEEKRLVIAALGEQNDPQALQILDPCFEDPALAQETCLAVVTFAANAASGAQATARPTREKSDIVPSLREVLRVSTSQEVREKARTILQRLEEKTE
jgi:HEAT repeat protein